MIIEKRDENGLLHCEDGPAMIFEDGEELYYNHGKLYGKTYKDFTMNGNNVTGKLTVFFETDEEGWDFPHRWDGPAIVFPDKKEEWWVHGRHVDFYTIIEKNTSLPDDHLVWTDLEKNIFLSAIQDFQKVSVSSALWKNRQDAVLLALEHAHESVSK